MVPLSVLSRLDSTSASRPSCALRDFTPFEAVVLGFLLFLHGRAWLAPLSAAGIEARTVSAALLLSALGAILVSRRAGAGLWLRRLCLLLPMLAAYLALRNYLPALEPQLMDAQLLAIDRYVLGQTPAVRFEPFSSPAVVEWFATFYYGYFLFLASHLLGTLVCDPGRRGDELLLGLLLVTAVGHALYTVVPGVGPHASPALFTGELAGGAAWDRVRQTVALAGARLDIFPSLHTAHPTLIALHALRHRARLPFRLSWPATLFAAANMTLATMVLRWHYAVDVFAGLVLAWLGHRIACLWLAQADRTLPGDC